MKDLPRLAADIMTKDVVTLAEDASLENLDEAMRALRFRHMPVVDDGRLVGIVSQRDIQRVSASSLLPSAQQQTAFLAKRFAVRDIMTRSVWTVRPDTPLAEVARLLRQSRVSCVPVVEGENTLVGIITEADFVRLYERLLTYETQSGTQSR